MSQHRLAATTLAALSCLCATLAAAKELTVEEVDRLCPPRAETAARFDPGAYPPAARSYREAALMAYRYMTSLRAMRALPETGKPDQKYQHNAYISKTHAAHICAMLDWLEADPSARPTALRFAKASAEFLLSELEPANAPLAFWPPTYCRQPLAFDPRTDGPYHKPYMVGNEPISVPKYRGQVMLLYRALYRAQGRAEDLAKAHALGDTITRVQQPSGRIPTFWCGVNRGCTDISEERYDWLNCMAAAAHALVLLDRERYQPSPAADANSNNPNQ